MLFFHLGDGLIKGMHEWIGILMVIGMVAHIFVHLRPFKRYFSQRVALIVMGVVLLTSTALINFEGGDNPMMAVIYQVESAPLHLVAELQGNSIQEVNARLMGAGWIVPDHNSSLAEIAKTNDIHPKHVISVAFKGE